MKPIAHYIIAFCAVFLPIAAHADPLTTAVVAAVGITGTAAAVASSALTVALGAGISFGISYVPFRRR